MSIHDHDFDAIAALVSEGRPLDAVADACEDCRSEYATQLQIRSLLMEAPLPEMSGPELATLRSGVNSSLGSPANRRMRVLVTAASVATGFLVIAGVGPLLLGGGQADDLAASAPETTVTETFADGGSYSQLTEEAAPTAAGAERAMAPLSEISDAGVVTDEELRLLEDQMRDSLEGADLKLGPAEYTDRERVVPPCLPETSVFGSIESELDGRSVVSYLIEDEDGGRYVERYEAATCELLERH